MTSYLWWHYAPIFWSQVHLLVINPEFFCLAMNSSNFSDQTSSAVYHSNVNVFYHENFKQNFNHSKINKNNPQ